MLSDILNQAKQQSKMQIDGVKNAAISGLAGAKANIANSVSTTAAGIVGSAVSGGTSAIAGAAADLMKGNPAAALTKITDLPGQALASLSTFGTSLFGGTGGSASISRPGGPIAPGDALAGASARSDPLMSFNWYAELPVLTPYNGGPVVCPWYYVEAANIPYRNYNIRSIFREGRHRHYPSDYSLDNLSLSFYMDESNVATQYTDAWRNLITIPESQGGMSGAHGRPNTYKKSIKIFFLSANRSTLAVYEYLECWPPNLSPLALNSSSERLIQEVSFSVGDLDQSFYSINPVLAAKLGSNPFPILSSVYNAVTRVATTAVTKVAANALSQAASKALRF